VIGPVPIDDVERILTEAKEKPGHTSPV
jgi:hypothetical protein